MCCHQVKISVSHYLKGKKKYHILFISSKRQTTFSNQDQKNSQKKLPHSLNTLSLNLTPDNFVDTSPDSSRCKRKREIEQLCNRRPKPGAVPFVIRVIYQLE